MKQTLLFCLMWFLTTTLLAQKTVRQDDPPQSYPSTVSKGVFLGNTPPLRELVPSKTSTGLPPSKVASKRNYFVPNKIKNLNSLPQDGDPLAKPASESREGGPEITPGLNFEGIRDVSGISPPDPTGDIGKNHYVQMTNGANGSWLQVFDKVTAQSVLGPIPSTDIWSNVGSGSIGDPIVQYDHDAERWVIMELQGFFVNELLIAVSDNSDPTSGWKVYRFQTQGFADYPKLYVWPNAYFITTNEVTGGLGTVGECAGYALERSAILANEPTFDIQRFVMPNYQALAYQPATGADWEGGPPPPAGSPGYIFRVYDDSWDGGQDHLQIWEVDVDWTNPAQSSITGPDKVFPAPFETRVCFGGETFNCIEQPDPGAPRIAAFESVIMYRAPYRNFGTYESVVLNHVSDVSGQVGDGGDAAVRWYELRKQGSSDWQIYQQGTYAPDLETNRFMGTICTDEAGNIALGYTGASEFLNPGVYLTGRRFNDPLGEMPVEEYTLAAGEQSHISDQRWGDYSNMSVDPEDGRTFWFTGEYQPSGVTWGTRIGSFKVQRDTYDIKPIALLAPVVSTTLGNDEPLKVKFLNGGLVEASGFSASVYFEGNLLATETIPTVLQPGENLEYTFSTTLDMPVAGKSYKIRIISHWVKDQFTRNDTLDMVVQKLTSNDVAAVDRYNLAGLVCGTETGFGIIIKNAAGVPLQSAEVNWRINNQPNNIYNWTGNLAPGKKDTIYVHATGVQNGSNELRIFTKLPNGQQDERTSNDTIAPINFTGNLDGTYLVVDGETQTGVLSWELRSQTNLLLTFGALSAAQTGTQICSDDNTCYKLILKSSTFSWTGHFRLYDIYGNVLVEATSASQNERVYNICTPAREQIDQGALALTSPVSGPGLSATEPIKMRFRNFGLTTLTNMEVAYRLNGGTWKTETYPGTITEGATAEHTFASTEDLSQVGGVFNFELKSTVLGDEQPANDTNSVIVRNRANRELELLELSTVQSCDNLFYALISLKIRNNGLGNSHPIDVKVTVNGDVKPDGSYEFSGAPGEIGDITIYVFGLQTGANTVTCEITNVDGQGEDADPSNDKKEITFDIDPDAIPIYLTFGTNDAPQENIWRILDDQNNVVASGGPYTAAFSTYIQELCLEKDKCYTLIINDAGSNGMVGGFINLSFGDGVQILSYEGDNFGAELSAPFCTNNICASLMLSVNVVNPSSAGASDGQITAIPEGGTPPYQFSLNSSPVVQSNPIYTNKPIGVYTIHCVDAVGCRTSTTIELGLVGIQEPKQVRSLKVSPNPTSGMANIELPAVGSEESVVCEVLDAKGRLVQMVRLVRWDNTLRGMAILDKQPAGLYFLRVRGLERPLTAKLIKR